MLIDLLVQMVLVGSVKKLIFEKISLFKIELLLECCSKHCLRVSESFFHINILFLNRVSFGKDLLILCLVLYGLWDYLGRKVDHIITVLTDVRCPGSSELPDM